MFTAYCAELNYDYGPDYVDSRLGVGSGDDVEFRYCLDCGQIQGAFPKVLEIDHS